jgi:hypothetical protein
MEREYDFTNGRNRRPRILKRPPKPGDIIDSNLVGSVSDPGAQRILVPRPLDPDSHQRMMEEASQVKLCVVRTPKSLQMRP